MRLYGVYVQCKTHVLGIELMYNFTVILGRASKFSKENLVTFPKRQNDMMAGSYKIKSFTINIITIYLIVLLRRLKNIYGL